jgi:hypothetical protein
MRSVVVTAVLRLRAGIAVLFMLAGAGCSTSTFRTGMVVVGGKPAFTATVEIGVSVGSKRLYEFTHENGVQADENGVAYTNAINADVVTLDEELGPIARIGPRMRAWSTEASIGARGTFYTGLFRDAKDRSGGLGIELAGGMQIGEHEGVFEVAIVSNSKWDPN